MIMHDPADSNRAMMRCEALRRAAAAGGSFAASAVLWSPTGQVFLLAIGRLVSYALYPSL
jgi:hypothetical protein